MMADNEAQQMPDDLVYPQGEAPDDLVYPSGEGPAGEQQTTSWGDVAASIPGNIKPSAGRFVSDLYQVARHPVDTATTLGRVGIGALQKTGLVEGDEYQGYADAVGQYFKERYGSMEGFKHSLAEDPIGVLGDASMALTGGSGALVKSAELTGRLGTVGRVASEVPRVVGRGAEIAGHYTNPLTPVAAVASPIASGLGKIASEAVGVQTGTGGLALRTAADAGYAGGDAAKAFRDHLRGRAEMADPVADARDALDQVRQKRGADYRAGMSDLSQDKTVLDFDDIDQAFARASQVRTFKGQDLSPSTAKLRQTLGDTLTDWRTLDPAEYHTAEGFDALKKKVGDILEATDPYSPERKMAGEVYNAIKGTIVKQAPAYGKIMNGYEDASNQIRELEKTLSLGNGATTDTALRKLQAILRDNVNTNFGQRRALADYLVRNGSPQLMEKLAGQSLNAVVPRGLGRFAMAVGADMSAILGGAILAHPAFLGLAPMIAMASPRLMGEGAYLAGRAASPLKNVPSGTATAARAVSPYSQVAGAVEPDETTQTATGVPPSSTDVRGALPVAGSEVGQAAVSSPSGPLKYGAALTTGVGGSRDDLSKHYPNYLNFGSMSPQEQKAALASLHGDTNISINERKRLEKMMLDRRGAPAMPSGVPQGSRAQRSDSTGLVRWLAPDGTIYSPSGNLAH
jgi:hypothetical protein